MLTAVLYYLLRIQAFRMSWLYEGWVFLGHLGLSVVGLVLAATGMRKHPVICGVAAVVSAFFLLIQLVP
jgi:hypothetical protein